MQKQLLFQFSPEPEDICYDGEVSLAVDHDDAIFGEGKVLVPLQVPVDVARGQHEGADILPALAVEDHNLVLICGHQEVTCTTKL